MLILVLLKKVHLQSYFSDTIDTLSLEMQVPKENANSATDSYSGQGKAEPALIQTHTSDAIEADS